MRKFSWPGGDTGWLWRVVAAVVLVAVALVAATACESPRPRVSMMAFPAGGGSTLRTACNLADGGPPATAYVRVRTANRDRFKVKVELLMSDGFHRVGELRSVGSQVVLGDVRPGSCLSARYSSGRAVTLTVGIYPG